MATGGPTRTDRVKQWLRRGLTRARLRVLTLLAAGVALLAILYVFVFTEAGGDMTSGDRLVGLGTLALAVATAWLASTSQAAERERRIEAQVLSASPLVVEHVGYDEGAISKLILRLENSSDRAVIDVRGTIRDRETDGGMSPAGFGIIEARGGHRTFTFELGGSFASEAVLEVVIESRGLMGQRVEQRYDFRQASVKLGEVSPRDAVVLTYLSVTPTRGQAIEIDARQ